MAIATGTAIAIAAGVGAGASIYGAKKGSDASKKAAEQQLGAGREAIGYQEPLYGKAADILAQQTALGGERLTPYADVGRQGLTSLAGLMGLGGGEIGAGLENTPGYQFRLKEGQKALERSAASRGSLLTGGTAKALTRYGQDYASNEYEKRLNQLRGVADLGYSAAGQTAGLGMNYAQGVGSLLQNQAANIGNALTGQGNVAAAGTIGSGNAWQQGLGQAGNLAQMYFLSRLYGTQPPGGAGGGSTLPMNAGYSG